MPGIIVDHPCVSVKIINDLGQIDIHRYFVIITNTMLCSWFQVIASGVDLGAL